MIRGEPRKPIRTGTLTTVQAGTGEVLAVRRNAGALLPPSADVCQECAVDHAHDQPHNRDSLYYQMAFHATHGRWPTWTDAMAHCGPDVRAAWRELLVEQFRRHGLPIPDDLAGDPPASPGR